jgi:hypothetical protein
MYLHQEYHGGSGFDAAVVWHDGKVDFGPMFTATHEGERIAGHYVLARERSESAINRSLRHMGVERGGAADEYAAVGLNLHRWTDEWASAG